MKDYYSILGVPRTASQNLIRDTYRKLAKQYHPDINPSPNADTILKELNEAYEVLGDPEKRAKYDQPVYYYEPEIKAEPVHRDRAYRRQQNVNRKNQESNRLQELTEEYKPIFLWICRVGLALSILIALDAWIPSKDSDEEITNSEFYRGSGRTASTHVITTSSGRKFRWHPEYNSIVPIELNTKVTLQVSRLFSNVLSIKLVNSDASVWIARIYTQLVFFPIILFASSCLGLFLRRRANAVLNLGTLSFVAGIICFFLVI